MSVIELERGQLLLDFGFEVSKPVPPKTYSEWLVTNKSDQDVRKLYDRHYTRDPKKRGNRQFTRPGKNVVFKTEDKRAGWIAWYSPYRKDGFDAFECTMFRNEAQTVFKSSELIKAAVLGTVLEFKEEGIPLPDDGLITYVNDQKIENQTNPGYCFMRAGFRKLKQKSKARGLTVLQISRNMIDLLFKEMDLKTHIKWCNDNIKLILNEGSELYEAFWFQQEAMRCRSELLEFQLLMKEMKIKAWSEYDKTVSWEALEELISPEGFTELDQMYNDYEEFNDDDLLCQLGGELEWREEQKKSWN